MYEYVCIHVYIYIYIYTVSCCWRRACARRYVLLQSSCSLNASGVPKINTRFILRLLSQMRGHLRCRKLCATRDKVTGLSIKAANVECKFVTSRPHPRIHKYALFSSPAPGGAPFTWQANTGMSDCQNIAP